MDVTDELNRKIDDSKIEIQRKEMNLKNETLMQFPDIYNILPHLDGQSTNIQSKTRISKLRFAKIVIGLPTVKRDKTSYFFETIKSLFDSMNEDEKLNVLVVVMIAEVNIISHS